MFADTKLKPYKASLRETHDPHTLLGLHSLNDTSKVIRLWQPGAKTLHLELFGKIVEAKKVNEEGLFECEAPLSTTLHDYRIFHASGLIANDPYAFYPTMGELDLHLFARGVHYELYNMLGAKVAVHQGCNGTKFAVWAPNAVAVSLVGDFNFWDGRINPMRAFGSGVWELFIPGIGSGEKYKFEIRTPEGHVLLKSDPFAFYSQMRPDTASIVFDTSVYTWTDQEWMEKRKVKNLNTPMNVYELHLGSWKRGPSGFLNYREIAHMLTSYCTEMHFTHVELMPVMEHPLDESWGYQVTGFFASTSRYGTPADFQYFVNYLHQNNIGILLDWVPAHFPVDNFSLARFDGSYLYEHADPRKGFHPHWNTYIFNYSRYEVSNFLIASALFWLERMHIDGFRVDAVASMLYLDYGRKEGEWLPNIYGRNENLEAIEFIKHLNSVVHERVKGVIMCAEESTSFTGVSHPLQNGGLGFDLKWNMGWMNDTLKYFHTDPLFRLHHHNELTFGLVYAFSEKFILVLSHDEVVHEKKSLISKMPGDAWQQFANVRLLYSYMMCQPGKKLLFMGGELGQWNEWNSAREVEWDLLRFFPHKNLQTCIKEMNHFYLKNSALWERDFDSSGFEWVDFSDYKNSVISYLRKSSSSLLFCVHNFTPSFFYDYFVRLQNVCKIREVFNTDHEMFGGSGKVNTETHIIYDHKGSSVGCKITLAPLATMIFEVEFVY